MSEQDPQQQPQESSAPQSQQEPPTDAAESPKDTLPENKVTIEDAGMLKKKVAVQVSQERVKAKFDEMFGELLRTAQVPGFRVGHAPRRLIEKRFGKEVSQDVRNQLVGEAIGQAIEKSALKTIGEPELDLEKIELPAEGELSFAFEVEVMPEFDLPALKGIKIERPGIEIDDERVDKQLEQWRSMRADYENTDQAANEGDVVVASGKIIAPDSPEVPVSAQVLRVAPGQVEGIPILDLGKALAGKKANDTAALTVKVPQAHPNEAWRDKEVKVELTIGEVRRRILPAMDDAFASALGFEGLQALRDAVRNRMRANIDAEVKALMRQKVEQYLLDTTKLDVPAGVAARHSENLLARRYVDLLYRGVPKEQVDERMTELKAQAEVQAQRDLKLRFILAKIIEANNIDVDDGEVNSRVAQMARQYDRRPERLRQELAADGRLEEVAVSLREEKALDQLVNDADVTEVAPKPDAEAPGGQ